MSYLTPHHSQLTTFPYTGRFKGQYLTISALQAANLTGIKGDWATINPTGAEKPVFYLWDTETSTWNPASITAPLPPD